MAKKLESIRLNILIVLGTILIFNCCRQPVQDSGIYPRMIGDIAYKEEKYEVNKIFQNSFDSENVEDESGLIRIRFIVNCHGIAGRYRIIGMDENYKEKQFSSSITDQLVSIVKDELQWAPFVTSKGQEVDYYMYLIFKIEQGKIIEILP